MCNQMLTENMKIWLNELYRAAAKEHRGIASNCHIVALWSDDKNVAQYEGLAEEHRDFAEILEDLANELDLE